MKLIIENLDGVLYAYMESEKHFKRVQNQRGVQVNPVILKNDCHLDSALENGEHMVFNILKP